MIPHPGKIKETSNEQTGEIKYDFTCWMHECLGFMLYEKYTQNTDSALKDSFFLSIFCGRLIPGNIHFFSPAQF